MVVVDAYVTSLGKKERKKGGKKEGGETPD